MHLPSGKDFVERGSLRQAAVASTFPYPAYFVWRTTRQLSVISYWLLVDRANFRFWMRGF
ncbi:hypothetical protein BLD44_024960 [Mastigocladus laminosus UU774]|nr:hypothetical protein BLD44_024960 [Mastigocladus laminosus UU774]